MSKRARPHKSGRKSTKTKSHKSGGSSYSGAGNVTATRTVAVERVMTKMEKKNIDTELNQNSGLGVETAISPIVSLVTPCVPGATAVNRLGRKILVKSLFIRGRIWATSGMTGAAFLRIIILQDREPNGALPTIANVMATDEIVGLMNLNNGQRYKVLGEIDLGGEGLSLANRIGATFQRYIKTNIVVSYKDGAGAGDATDVLANGIYAVTYIGGGSMGAASCNMIANVRVRFVDQ